MLLVTYYAQNYASIICQGLPCTAGQKGTQKQKNKGTIKNGSRQRARRGLDKIGTQKQKNKGKKNESIARQRARGGLAKNKAGQLM